MHRMILTKHHNTCFVPQDTFKTLGHIVYTSGILANVLQLALFRGEALFASFCNINASVIPNFKLLV